MENRKTQLHFRDITNMSRTILHKLSPYLSGQLEISIKNPEPYIRRKNIKN